MDDFYTLMLLAAGFLIGYMVRGHIAKRRRRRFI